MDSPAVSKYKGGEQGVRERIHFYDEGSVGIGPEAPQKACTVPVCPLCRAHSGNDMSLPWQLTVGP
eukprot:4118256-Pyramimonas_sp.AAC.1